jgi:sirohydrochlorin cobaltochelatase
MTAATNISTSNTLATDKAILIVSFGTSFEDTRRKTLDLMLLDVVDAFPDYLVCEAWTSPRIIRKVMERDGLLRLTVTEALEQLKDAGIREVYVQPTHMINGFETERLKRDVQAFQNDFSVLRTGTPLLTAQSDLCRLVEILSFEYAAVPEDTALVFMGHGTEHPANAVYAALDDLCKEMGHSNYLIGTVEASPTLENVLHQVQTSGFHKVILTPLMMVAGDHANHDLAGEDRDSWLSRFTQAGFETSCIIKGLGEMSPVRDLLIRHLRTIL